ncbi:hypothetical protein FRC04_005177 [Tulasnella sp. 424]|nr:hypothetical protein FRC04_005177 [Tulasnella sp. 424]KAG8963057.1 hypothetical protein FRC05_004939 [Tulasnella sp. 425]
MTIEPPRPTPPAPEAVAQALALLLKAMEDSEPAGDEDGQDIESNMTHLDRLAWRRQVAGETLQRAAQTEAALFRRRRNTLLPIHRLPSELLSAILIKSVDENQVCRMESLQVLAQVAWQWWQTIKSDPQFWAHITPPMGGVELQIRKAGILPLRLGWPTSVDEEYHDAFKDLLQRHAERWTSIDLESGHENPALQVLCTSPFPRLEYLKVCWTSLIMSGVWRFNLANFQNLQEAHLPIVPYLSVSPTPSPPIRLQTLHLNLRSRRPHAPYDLESLESLLRCIPQLINLEVENLYSSRSLPAPADTPLINLPMLRRLRFSNVVSGQERDQIPLLAQIRAPLLERLGLRYQTNTERWSTAVDVGGRTIFDALVTRPHALLGQPEDEPLLSVLRNAGPSASWTVEVAEREVLISAKSSGRGQLDIHCSTKDYVPAYILQPLTGFTLPVDLSIICSRNSAKLAFWDDVLDATPLLLRSFILLDCPDRIAGQVMDRLSTKAPFQISSKPRAPLLEELCFQERLYDEHSWSEGDLRDAVKTMLEKRRNLFTESGELDPPKLVVVGSHGLVFDEVEGRWLDWNGAQS